MNSPKGWMASTVAGLPPVALGLSRQTAREEPQPGDPTLEGCWGPGMAVEVLG